MNTENIKRFYSMPAGNNKYAVIMETINPPAQVVVQAAGSLKKYANVHSSEVNGRAPSGTSGAYMSFTSKPNARNKSYIKSFEIEVI